MHLQAMSGFKSWSLIRQSETPLVEVRLLIPYDYVIWYVKINKYIIYYHIFTLRKKV